MPTSLIPGRRVDPAPPTGQRPVLRRWLALAALGILFTAAALVLAEAIGAELGLQVGLLATGVAMLPLGVVVPSLLWLDRYEEEPDGHLWFAFLWGGLIATTVSLVANTGSLILLESYSQRGHDVAAVAVAPVVEEVLKGTGVLLILLFRRREFDGIVDGLVYAGLSAAGFAFAENILYLGRAVIEGGTEGLVAVFVLRCVLGPFAHPVFTCCTGIGIGIAALRSRGAVRVLAPLLGLLAAILLHGLWNLSAVLGLEGFYTRYLVLQLPVFVAAIGFAAWSRQREGQLIGRYLVDYVTAGWLSDREVAMLQGLPARRQAREWAAHLGGRVGARAMRDFQDDGTELAFLRQRMAHGTAPATARAEERELLDRMTVNRSVFLQPLRSAGP